jgi:uncharacterized protein YjdB
VRFQLEAKRMERATLAIPMLPILCIGIALLLSTLPLPAQAAEQTTEVRVVKYASDKTTVLSERAVTCGWMEANLPVQGDGVTPYYQQGPVFNSPPGPWDEDETANLKDKGALKGTDIKDLCNLVEGMSAEDEIKITASDGFSKWFGYKNVYSPQQRQGLMVLCWYRDGDRVPDFEEGLQIVFFADDNVFGNWDMHESLAPKYRYNYSSDYPSANGLSVKWISEIAIYSMMDPPKLHSIEVSPGEATLDISGEKQFTGAAYDQYASEMSDMIFTWASSDKTVGTIDASGRFTALAAGKTVIMAKNGGVQGTASVTVSSPAPTASPSPTLTPSQVMATLTVLPAAATLNVGEAQQFTGVAYDRDHREMSDIVFVWTSSDKAVGTIDASGLFTAYGAGDATVTAENDGVIGLAGVTVDLPTPAPASTKAETQPEDLTPSQSSVPAPGPSPLPSATSPVPKATPNSSGFKTPGFEAMFAITGLLMVACLIKRRKV